MDHDHGQCTREIGHREDSRVFDRGAGGIFKFPEKRKREHRDRGHKGTHNGNRYDKPGGDQVFICRDKPIVGVDKDAENEKYQPEGRRGLQIALKLLPECRNHLALDSLSVLHDDIVHGGKCSPSRHNRNRKEDRQQVEADNCGDSIHGSDEGAILVKKTSHKCSPKNEISAAV